MKAKKTERPQSSNLQTRRQHRRIRRWLVMAPIVLVTAITILWLAPAIVAHTALRQQILSSLLSDFEGSVTVGSASLGWLSPVVADDIEAVDPNGQPLATIPSLRSEQTLLALLSDRTRIGRIQIERPTVYLAFRQDGSNWQDAVAPLLAKPAQPATVEQLSVQITEGQIDILDATGDNYRVDQLNLTLQLGSTDTESLKLDAEAALGAGEYPPGKIAVDMAWQPGVTKTQPGGNPPQPSGEGRVVIRSESIPLGPLVAAIRQLVGDVRVEGTATCDAVYQWSERAGTQAFQIDRLAARDVSLYAPQWLGDDRLQTTYFNAAARVEGDATQWRVQSLSLDTDFAQLQVQGSLKTADIADAGSWAELSRRLAGQGTRVDGQVDLAQLAGMLSGTLGLRPSTQLQSGTAKFWLAGVSDGQAGWTAGLEATGLAAIDGGVRVQQQELIRFTAAIQPASDGPTTYQIDCQSAFLQAAIRGTGPEGSVRIQEADLNKFASEVGPFVGLSNDQLFGRLQGDIQWRRSSENQVSAQGKLQLNRFRFVTSSDEAWEEDQLSVDLAATADVRDGQLTRVLTGSMVAMTDDGQLSVNLLSPIEGPGLASPWSVHVRGTASLTSEAVALDSQEFALQMSPNDLSIDGTFRYRADLQRLSNLLQKDGRAPDQQLTGVITGVAQITHINGVTQADWTGIGSDVVYASRQGVASGAVITSASHRPVLLERWHEPMVKLSGRKRYDHRQDLLELDQFLVETPTLRVSTSGHIRDLSVRCMADLTGEVQGDLAKLSDRLRPILGPNIQLVGQEWAQFTVKGPLTSSWATQSLATADRQVTSGQSVSMASAGVRQGSAVSVISPDLKGDASFGWQSANIHSLIVGRGNLTASLEQGVIQFAPLQVPISDGRFLGRPWIDLRDQSVSLRIDKGPLVENVRISPEMCSAWLKYVAPLLSNATRAEGRFSIALDSADVPLADQTRSDVHGQLTIHSAQVGPGPLAQQLISIARDVKSVIDGRPPGTTSSQDATWLVVPEQSIQFDVRDGRVAHRRLVVQAGDLQIITSGSVGLDESLAMVVEVPVRDQWVAGRQYVDALKGTVIKVPVHGTFSQPRIDNQALRDLSRQMIGGAAGRVLENELNRGLQQLFGR